MDDLFPVAIFPEVSGNRTTIQYYRELERLVKQQEGEIADTLQFPQSLITGFAGAFAHVYSEVLESVDYAFFMAALTCLGSVIAGKGQVSSELPSDPRLYTLFLGESGHSRKSTAAERAIKFFHDYYSQSFRWCKGVGSAEGLYKELSARTYDNRLLLYFDEFQQFVQKCSIDGSTLLQMVNILFESRDYDNTTSKRPMCLRNCHHTLMAATTYGTYDTCWTKAFADIGFANRLFIVPLPMAQRKNVIPPPVSPEMKQGIADRLTEVMETVGYERQYEVHPYAYRYLQSWYKKLETTPHATRLESYAMRLLTLIAANDNKTEIDLETATKAVLLCNWQLAVRKQYDPIDAENPYARMETKIQRELEAAGRPMLRSELYRATHASRYGMHIFDSGIENLRKSGVVCQCLDKKLRLE